MRQPVRLSSRCLKFQQRYGFARADAPEGRGGPAVDHWRVKTLRNCAAQREPPWGADGRAGGGSDPAPGAAGRADCLPGHQERQNGEGVRAGVGRAATGKPVGTRSPWPAGRPPAARAGATAQLSL